MARWFSHTILAETDVEQSTLEQRRSIWLAKLESYQHRFHVAREDVTAKFHSQQQIVDQELRKDFYFMDQRRLERDVTSLFDRYQTEIRALRRAEIEREYAHSLEHLDREEQEMIHQHQLLFPLPTTSAARVPDGTPFWPSSNRHGTALANSAMVPSLTEAPSRSRQIQVSLPHDAGFREESYQQRHSLSTRHPADSSKFALPSELSSSHNTMARSHTAFHSHETPETDRLRHETSGTSPGHAFGSWPVAVDGCSERRTDQFRAIEASHNLPQDHARLLQTARHDQLMRLDSRSGQQTNSNHGCRQPAKPSNDRIEFDEVYQDGKAEFKHTIVKFSNKFYILKHGVHFKQNALIAAAKHLNSALHGFMRKDFRQAIGSLGIRVLNCTDELAKLNNDVVRHAFEMGYKPMNLLRSRYNSSKHQSSHDTPTPPPERALSSPAVSRQTPVKEDVSEGVLNPKAGELYCANFPRTNKTSVVMALGWKDLSMCGRGEMFCDLALYKDMPRPRCYEFDNEGIIGWAPGYGDGESLESSREVPVMRCESNGEDCFMWTSVRLLTPFRLDEPGRRCDADAGELRIRQIYARVRGFESSESMLAFQAIKEGPRRKYPRKLIESHGIESDSEPESHTTGSRSLQTCGLGTEVPGDDAITETRSVRLTDSVDFDNFQDTLRNTVESAYPSFSSPPDIQEAEVCHPAAPAPPNTESQSQPGKAQTFEPSSLPNSREETASHNPGASVVLSVEQLVQGQAREEEIRRCTPYPEPQAETIEVLLSPPIRSSDQLIQLEADRPSPASPRARHRRQLQRAAVRQSRNRQSHVPNTAQVTAPRSPIR